MDKNEEQWRRAYEESDERVRKIIDEYSTVRGVVHTTGLTHDKDHWWLDPLKAIIAGLMVALVLSVLIRLFVVGKW